MVGFFVDAVDLVEARAAGDIDLAADDGLDPGLLCCAVKSIVPYMTPWSVRAMASWPISCTRSIIEPIRQAPSSRLYSLWTCRCTNAVAGAPFSARSQAQRACALGGSSLIWKQADPAWRQAPAASPQGSPDGASRSRGAWAAGPELAALLQLPDGRDLLHRRVDDLGQIRGRS